VSLGPRLFFEDPGLWKIALKALVEGPKAVDQIYCESLGIETAPPTVEFRRAEAINWARPYPPRIQDSLRRSCP
jgi:hypothetical protein